MSISILFLAAIAAIVFWWLSRHRLTAKPWLEQGVIDDAPGMGAPTLPTAKIGLGVFLAVAGSLFALLVSAYSMRMDMPDWRSLPVPILLWVNTGALVLSSIGLHCAKVAVRHGQIDDVRTALLAGGAATLVFVVGQILAWQQLAEVGFALATNPANSFFYLITAVHGLHVLGGLIVLGRTAARARDGSEAGRLRLSVELCAMYWHFLLVVWLVLFTLLMGWADDFVEICRQLLS